MLAVKSMDVRDNFKTFCDRAFNGEALIVSRPRNENVVIISEAEFNELLRLKNNIEYTEKLKRGISALNAGKGVEHEIIEDIDE